MYMSSPERIIDTQYGKVRLAFTGGGHAYVSTDIERGKRAEGLTYRNSQYLVSIDVYAEHNWTPGPDGRDHIDRRATFGAGDRAPRTYHAAMLAEIETCIRAAMSYDDSPLRAGDYAQANNRIETLDSDILAAEAQLRALRAERDKWITVRDANR